MQLIDSIEKMNAVVAELRREGKRIGFVPTMGALHEGHLSLVRFSAAECDATFVSIFVNPSQFGPNEDFSKYPRTLEADMKLLSSVGADYVFTPTDAMMYPPNYCTWVVPVGPASPLEGERRPGHFRGVATVVLKLFNLVQPAVAFFGRKDYQQTLVIRRMAADLNLPTEIRVCPIVREADGLAMSSRNRYLSPAAREKALALSRSLQLARQMVSDGERDAKKIVAAMQGILTAVDGAEIDYVVVADADDLHALDALIGRAVALLAVKIEQTRLIDNCFLEVD